MSDLITVKPKIKQKGLRGKANRLLSLSANLYPRYMRQMNMAIIKKTPKKPNSSPITLNIKSL